MTFLEIRASLQDIPNWVHHHKMSPDTRGAAHKLGEQHTKTKNQASPFVHCSKMRWLRCAPMKLAGWVAISLVSTGKLCAPININTRDRVAAAACLQYLACVCVHVACIRSIKRMRRVRHVLMAANRRRRGVTVQKLRGLMQRKRCGAHWCPK